MTRSRRKRWAVSTWAVALGIVTVASCGSGSRPAATGCHPGAGGRCAGAEPVAAALVGSLHPTPDRRTVWGRFPCGGRLTARETAQQVALTYVASAVGHGAMSCALVPLAVVLAEPLGHRRVVDAETGQVLRLGAPAPAGSRQAPTG
jgi:hypothetical protein